MTFAGYGHPKHKRTAIWLATAISGLIALREDMLAISDNRIGSAVWTAARLTMLQEVITLTGSAMLPMLCPLEALKGSALVGFARTADGAAPTYLGKQIGWPAFGEPEPGAARSSCGSGADADA